MKKFICVLLSLIVVASLITISVSAIDVPTSATPLAVDTHLRFCFAQYPYDHWYSGDSSPLLDDWQDGTLIEQTPIVYPSVIFGNGFATYDIQDTTTYYMQYELTTQDTAYFYGMTTNAAFYKLVPSQLLRDIYGNYTSTDTSVTMDPRNFGLVTLSEISREISTTVTQVGSQTYRVGLAFSTKAEVEPLALSAIMFTSVGVLDEKDRLEFVSFQAWTDENLSIYEDLVAGKLDDINNSIQDVGDQISGSVNDAADQITGSIEEGFEDLNNTLIGNDDEVVDNTGVGNSVDELGQLEDNINSQITSPITLPDGSSINVDGNALGNINDYITQQFDPEGYDLTTGQQIAKVFNYFMPYMGTVIFLNLMLGLSLAFLRGKTNA